AEPLRAGPRPHAHQDARRCRFARPVRVERPRAPPRRLRAGAARARPVPRPGRLRGRGSRAREDPGPARLHRRPRLVPAREALAELAIRGTKDDDRRMRSTRGWLWLAALAALAAALVLSAP